MAIVKKKSTKSVEGKVKKSKLKTEAKAEVKAKKKPSAAKPTAKPVKKAAKAEKAVKKSKKSAVADNGIKPIKTAFNKTSLAQHIADDTGLERRDVTKVFGSLERVIAGSLHRKGLGEFMMPGMFKIVTKHIPARKIEAIKKGTMVKNPFNGGKLEPHKGRPAGVKPASIRVKIRPMKKIKDAAAA